MQMFRLGMDTLQALILCILASYGSLSQSSGVGRKKHLG